MEQLLAAVLRGEPAAWPPDAGWADPKRFLAAAARHGVVPLLVHALDRTKTLDQWPPAIREPLVQAARRQVWVETQHRSELEQVLSALATLDVPALLMKGAALAYLYYPDPCLRPRYDTDLLVRKDDMPAVTRVLQASGYRRSNLTSGDLVMPQRQFVRDDRHDWCMPTTCIGRWRSPSRSPTSCRGTTSRLAPSKYRPWVGTLAPSAGSTRCYWRASIGWPIITMTPNGCSGSTTSICWHTTWPESRSSSSWNWPPRADPSGVRGGADARAALVQHQATGPGDAHAGGGCGRTDPGLPRWSLTESRCPLVGSHGARRVAGQVATAPRASVSPVGVHAERSGVSSRLVLPALYASRIVRGAWRWFRRP